MRMRKPFVRIQEEPGHGDPDSSYHMYYIMHQRMLMARFFYDRYGSVKLRIR